ncbi:MAG TPA: FkbM family methyltransferase [Pyrinomonadaceae bacterium]|nr:FkbM family methyltransferase [Pyrinomonadaceae bacterium]
MKGNIENLVLKTVRLYTFNTPIAKGRHRAYLTALKLCKTLPDSMLTETKDGRKFSVHLKTGMQSTVYFLGEYEKALTEIVKAVLREGDVCLDVGANFGWYTTIFQKYCGPTGEVHAFEPVPPTFRELEENYALMGRPSNVFINHLALGEKADELTINLFEGLSSGHASMSDQGRADAISFKCDVVTLDSYLQERNVPEVNFVKVDIEGAELMFLKGAEKLFAQKTPPIWLMEMALQQTGNFGYVPNDLINFMRARAEYDFFKVDEPNTRLIKIESFEEGDVGANVIAFPRGPYRDRLTSLTNYLNPEPR